MYRYCSVIWKWKTLVIIKRQKIKNLKKKLGEKLPLKYTIIFKWIFRRSKISYVTIPTHNLVLWNSLVKIPFILQSHRVVRTDGEVVNRIIPTRFVKKKKKNTRLKGRVWGQGVHTWNRDKAHPPPGFFFFFFSSAGDYCSLIDQSTSSLTFFSRLILDWNGWTIKNKKTQPLRPYYAVLPTTVLTDRFGLVWGFRSAGVGKDL